MASTTVYIEYEQSSVASVHWTALIIYLCVYLSGLLGVTITGWALYQARPKKSRSNSTRTMLTSTPNTTNTSPTPTPNSVNTPNTPNTPELGNTNGDGNAGTATNGTINNMNTNDAMEPLHQHQLNNHQAPLDWRKYFTLWRRKWRILLSASIHILVQGLNFAVLVEFLSLALSETYYFDPNRISHGDIMEICIISLIGFSAYRLGSAILIWRLSHSVRKSTFQIIDVTILYQLLKGYKKKTRNNPGRIVQYINYLNAMLQSFIAATVQLVFIMKVRILSDGKSSSYPFIFIIVITCILNIGCVTSAVYEKDQLLTSETYRTHKTLGQIFSHYFFRLIDISLRVILLAMLWLTIGFGGVLIIFLMEMTIIGYLAYYTQQHYRLQELVAVLLHISSFNNLRSSALDDDDKLRPLTPATIRMKNNISIEINVNPSEMEKKEEERKREMVRECQCFKWRILTNIIYMVIVTLFAETRECLICPDYEERSDLIIGNLSGTVLTIFCWLAIFLYPIAYWSLKNSNRWSKKAASLGLSNDEDNIFAYLERKDFESAKEILEFGKKVEKDEYYEWANKRDWSMDNNPNLLLKFLYQQKVKINAIINVEQGGLNVLHQISKNPELENAQMTIKFLLEYLGMDIYSKTEKTKDSSLHIACSHCNKDAMLALLHAGGGEQDLFLKNDAGQTPLHSLMIGYGDVKYHKNQLEMTSILFEKYNGEQIILETDKQGKSPLHIACLNKLTPKDIIKLLLLNGAYSHQGDNDDYFPKDYVNQWKSNRNDKKVILKWLNEGLPSMKNNNSPTSIDDDEVNELKPINKENKKKYVELSEVDSGNISAKLHKSEEEEMRRIYGDDSDEEDDDDDKNNEEKEKQIDTITPMDNNELKLDYAKTKNDNQSNDDDINNEKNVNKNDDNNNQDNNDNSTHYEE